MYDLDVVSVRASEGTPAQYTIESIDGDNEAHQDRRSRPDDHRARTRYEITYTLRRRAERRSATTTSCCGTRSGPTGRCRSTRPRVPVARAGRHHQGQLLHRAVRVDPAVRGRPTSSGATATFSQTDLAALRGDDRARSPSRRARSSRRRSPSSRSGSTSARAFRAHAGHRRRRGGLLLLLVVGVLRRSCSTGSGATAATWARPSTSPSAAPDRRRRARAAARPATRRRSSSCPPTTSARARSGRSSTSRPTRSTSPRRSSTSRCAGTS